MSAPRIIVTIILFISSLAMLDGCAATASGGGDRKQVMPVSPPELNHMAAQSYTKLKSDAALQGVLNHDLVLLQRANMIVNRLMPQTRIFRPEALSWNWEVNVISTNQVNAFCLPGGKIMVFSGLYRQLNLSDDELAVVIGHVISHTLRDHWREQVSQALAARPAADSSQGSADFTKVDYQVFLAAQFSNADEYEADRMGLELMARAGYDPRAGITFWQKMINIKDGLYPPVFFSSHPTDAGRAQTIQSLLPLVMPFYEAIQQQ